MAPPKPSTAASNTYAALPSDSETSPTTSPAASSKPEDSDPNYTLNYEEPVKYRIESFDGTICTNQNIHVSKKHYESTLTFIMTWSEGKWQELQGRIISDNE